MGPLPLLMGMDEPWISGLPCVGWLCPLTFHVMHSGAPLCIVLVGFLPLAMFDAGGGLGRCGSLCVLVVMGPLFWSVCVVC